MQSAVASVPAFASSFEMTNMACWQRVLTWIAVLPLGIAPMLADEVRYYEQNGVTMRETRHTVQQPVCEVRWQPTSRTVYREQLTTECREQIRTTWTPVTQYRCQPCPSGLAGPAGQACVGSYLVPETRWEARQETIKTPVVCRRWVPQTETVQAPVATQRMISQEVVTHVAVNAKNEPLNSAANIASCSPNGQPALPACQPCRPCCPIAARVSGNAAAPVCCPVPVQRCAATARPTLDMAMRHAATEGIGGIAKLE
jgi:hypothetical protein